MAARCRREVRVACRRGLHLAQATRLAALARRFQAAIRLRRETLEVDAKDVLDLLRLGAGPGVRLEVLAEGPDAPAAGEAVCAFFTGALPADP